MNYVLCALIAFVAGSNLGAIVMAIMNAAKEDRAIAKLVAKLNDSQKECEELKQRLADMEAEVKNEV